MHKQIITITFLKEQIIETKRHFRRRWGCGLYSKKAWHKSHESLGDEIFKHGLMCIQAIEVYEYLIYYIRQQRKKNG